MAMIEAQARPTNGTAPASVAVRRAALVVRVSTDRQAMNDEGSLKNQLQRLRQHIEYKTGACGEAWSEGGVYELRAVSGKDSIRSPEFQRLFGDIKAGRINTILCTALDRISRSVKDFLQFFEFINSYGVEFVCLKQNYDTTTPQGRLFVTIMMALAQFEREQTSDRTKEATAARAERGLWNGGQLLGYDLNKEQKGRLIPNHAEAAVVNFAFDTYLKTGSLAETAKTMNARGYRTKEYESRRGKLHAGTRFRLTTVQYLLKNPAYIGQKEINKKRRNGAESRLVEAVWLPIIDAEKFREVQRLLEANSSSNHNGAKRIRHPYVLSPGLLCCGRCGTTMEGRSGTGRLGTRYFYYVCRNNECGMRVAAEEIEEAVIEHIKALAEDSEMLTRIVEQTNKRLSQWKRNLVARRRMLGRSIEQVRSEADALLANWTNVDHEGGRSFMTERLTELAERRGQLEQSLGEVDVALSQLEGERIAAEKVQDALSNFTEVYGCLTPLERKELIRLVLRRAEINERELVLEVYPITDPERCLATGMGFAEPPNWLPGQDSNLQPGG